MCPGRGATPAREPRSRVRAPARAGKGGPQSSTASPAVGRPRPRRLWSPAPRTWFGRMRLQSRWRTAPGLEPCDGCTGSEPTRITPRFFRCAPQGASPCTVKARKHVRVACPRSSVRIRTTFGFRENRGCSPARSTACGHRSIARTTKIVRDIRRALSESLNRTAPPFRRRAGTEIVFTLRGGYVLSGSGPPAGRLLPGRLERRRVLASQGRQLGPDLGVARVVGQVRPLVRVGRVLK